MGAMKEKATPPRAQGKGTGSGIDWGQASKGTPAAGVEWADADPALLSTLIAAATRRGMAVSFSATTRSTGVSITLLDGGDRPKWYADNPESLDVVLNMIIDVLAQH